MRQRQRLRHLRQRVFLHRVQQQRQHVYLEEAANDALQLQAYRSRSQHNGLAGKLVAGKVVVALNGAGNERCEVQRVKQVSAKAYVLFLVSISCFDEQMQHAEKNVGKSQREVRGVQEDALRQERVFFQPYIDKDNRQNAPDNRSGPAALD